MQNSLFKTFEICGGLLHILNISKVIWLLFYFILVCLNLFRSKIY